MPVVEKLSLAEDPKALTVQSLLEPLRPLLDRPDVTELTINQPGEVWAKTFGGWEPHTMPELSLGYIEALLKLVAVLEAKAL